MGSKFQGIPKFYQEKGSPIVQDSAFPPFKLEHRYRGVYERAGFDVNRPRVITDGGSTHYHSTPSLNGKRPNDRYDCTSLVLKAKSDSGSITNKPPPPVLVGGGLKSGEIVYSGHHRPKQLPRTESSQTQLPGTQIPPTQLPPEQLPHRQFGENVAYNQNDRFTNTGLSARNNIRNHSGNHFGNHPENQLGTNGINFNHDTSFDKSIEPGRIGDNFNEINAQQNNYFQNNNDSRFDSYNSNNLTTHSQNNANLPQISPNHQYNHNISNSPTNQYHQNLYLDNSHQNHQNNHQGSSNDDSINHNKSHSSNSFNFKRDTDDIIDSPPSSNLSAAGLTGTSSSVNIFSDNDIITSDVDSNSPTSLVHAINESQAIRKPSDAKFSLYNNNEINRDMNGNDYDSRSHHENENTKNMQNLNSIPKLAISSPKSVQPFDPRSKSTNKRSNLKKPTLNEIHQVYETPAIHSNGVPYPNLQRFSYGHPSSNKPQDDFKNFQTNQSADYQNFLSSDIKGNENVRQSALSMVSSIISKDSFINEDDDVEPELQMQLASLKLHGGANLAIDSPSIQQKKSIPEIFIDEANSAPSVHKTSSEEAKSLDDDHEDLNHIPPIERNQNIPTFSINEDSEDMMENSPINHVDIQHSDSNELKNQTVSVASSEEVTLEDIQPINANPISLFEKTLIRNEYRRHESLRSSVSNGVPYPIDDMDDSVKMESFNSEDLNEISSSTSYENLEPLFVRQSLNEAKKVSTTIQSNSQYENTLPESKIARSKVGAFPDPRDYVDSVKPLSPKVHQVEKELAGINFKMEKVDGSPSDFLNQDFKNDSGNQVDEYQQHRPGEGPCRSCRCSIIPGLKGPQRPIYSKTGELSGQWHRSCFSCSFEDCPVVFSKHVQCYAFEDLPYCNHHYHIVNSTICENCNTGIEGECIENELEQKWHLNCLKCQKCHNNIKQDYYIINNYTFCEVDAMNIISGKDGYNDSNGARTEISQKDRIEKRRTRLLFLD